jgi:cell division protein FtsB
MALLGGFGVCFYSKICKLNQLRQQQLIYEERMSLLEAEVSRLIREIDGLQNDPAQLEKLAREKLGMAGKNEKIFIIEVTPTPVDN